MLWPSPHLTDAQAAKDDAFMPWRSKEDKKEDHRLAAVANNIEKDKAFVDLVRNVALGRAIPGRYQCRPLQDVAAQLRGALIRKVRNLKDLEEFLRGHAARATELEAEMETIWRDAIEAGIRL